MIAYCSYFSNNATFSDYTRMRHVNGLVESPLLVLPCHNPCQRCSHDLARALTPLMPPVYHELHAPVDTADPHVIHSFLSTATPDDKDAYINQITTIAHHTAMFKPENNSKNGIY